MNCWEFLYKIWNDIIQIVLILGVILFLTPPGWYVLYCWLK